MWAGASHVTRVAGGLRQSTQVRGPGGLSAGLRPSASGLTPLVLLSQNQSLNGDLFGATSFNSHLRNAEDAGSET